MHSVTAISVPEAKLTFVLGAERKEFMLGATPFTVGRKSDKDLVFTDSVVSRDHAIIFREDGGYVVEDQKSKHGTFVNGERITRRRLRANDQIEFGGRGAGYLLFDPDSLNSSDAHSFLTQFAAKRPNASSGTSDLEMLTLFVEAARQLNSSGVLEDVLLALLDSLLKLTRSERAYVFVRAKDGTFQLAAGRNEQGAILHDGQNISQSILQEAITSGSEFLVTGTEDLDKLANRGSVIAQNLRTIICIPLRGVNIQGRNAEPESGESANEVRTVLYLDATRTAVKLSSVSHEILRAIARDAATLIENARLVQSEQAMRRFQQELAIASSIQQRLMLMEIPQVSFARVTARSIPCTDVGGDFYDVIARDDELAVVVADVCGKGIPAAIMASIIQGMLYGHLMQGRGLAEGVAAVNQFLCERNLGEKYATLLVARLKKDGVLEYVNCGHVPPLIISGSSAKPATTANLPVGLFAQSTFTAGSVQLEHGDRFLIVTDGVTEAESQNGDFFTFERLQETAGGWNGVAELMQAITAFCQGVPLLDDCTALDLVYQGQNIQQQN